jgi:adenylosuccinate synthase
MREFKDLPAAAQRYVERLSELVDCEIGIVSTGPERNHTILRGRSASARWFE